MAKVRNIDRRTFVTGSALFAASLCAGAYGCSSSVSGGSYTTSVGTTSPASGSVSASASTSAASASVAMNGDQITAACAYDAQDYLPWTASSPLSWSANRHVTEGLYEIDLRTYTTYAALAADEPEALSDTEYRVTLRDGAAFSDGTAVSAVDIETSYERLVAAGSPLLPLLACIASIAAEDGEDGASPAVIVTTSFATPYLKERLSLIRIVPAAVTDDVLSSTPVGSGPWMYASVGEQSVVFTPNPHYNGPYPAADRSMVWEIAKDDDTRVTDLSNGAIEVAESVPPSALTKLVDASTTTVNLPGVCMPFLMFNTKKKPFDDYRVRQAFLYAIDTDKLVFDVLKGYASAASCMLPTTHASYHKATTVYTHDAAQATALLTAAGVSDLSITLDTTDHAWITALSSQIASDLKAVGVTVSVQVQKTASLYAYRTDIAYPSFDVVLAPGDAALFGNDPDALLEWWFGGNIWTQRRSQWADSAEAGELSALMQQARVASGAEAQGLWNACFDLIAEQAPLYPLLHRRLITAYKPGTLDGYAPSGTSGLDFIGASSKG